METRFGKYFVHIILPRDISLVKGSWLAHVKEENIQLAVPFWIDNGQ